MFRKGNQPWNKYQFDDAELAREYALDRGAVRRLAEKYGCSIQVIYQRLAAMGIDRRKGGNASIGTQARERNPNWKGGKTIDAAGYVVVRLSNRIVREHRLVAERMLGRPLLPGEVVHHKNGVRSDNRPENLEILPSQSEHMRHHMTKEEARTRGARGRMRRLAALKAVRGG